MIRVTLANFLLISGFINSSINYIDTNLILLSQLSSIIPLITENDKVENNKEEEDDEKDDPIVSPKEVKKIKLL